MTSIVDFHVHVFDNPDFFALERVKRLRKYARKWVRPFSHTLHEFQTHLRYLPCSLRRNLDQLSGIIPLPNLLLESSPSDLLEAMTEAQVDYALVIAHPPIISNEFVLEVCKKNQNLIPIVKLPKTAHKPQSLLKKYVQQGAKGIKVHPASDGDLPTSPRYSALLKAASDLGLPVIIHTGCIFSHILYKDPKQARAERFSQWFKTYPKTRFILAHMNFHEPGIALDLCEEYTNVFVDTSWQPAEVIGEATRRIGADRILFGTDWPLVGSNLMVCRNRITNCVETGLLNEEQARLILGGNALKLLGLPAHAL